LNIKIPSQRPIREWNWQQQRRQCN